MSLCVPHDGLETWRAFETFFGGREGIIRPSSVG